MDQPLFLGIDLGSSFIKMILIDMNQNVVKVCKYPQKQLQIESVHQNWAQQDPQIWWNYVKLGFKQLFESGIQKQRLKGIGISYQMHGLVLVDKQLSPVRKSIIWCDGRTVQIGKQLYQKIKDKSIQDRILNHPSNFTISKLVWVKENQSQNYEKVYKFMLPGDYIAMKITGKCSISETGLSEGVMWNYQDNKVCQQIFQVAGISLEIIPQVVQNFEVQNYSSEIFNKQFGFPQKIPICYRSGDQPNNAFSLGVMEPGEVAVTGGTSGVIYAISDNKKAKEKLKFNSFLHINNKEQNTRIGKLLCINGCGSIYQWIKTNFVPNLSYQEMNQMAEEIKETNVMVIPFGNGVERMLDNKNTKCEIKNIDFNRHSVKDIVKGTLQSIVFSFVYGAEIMREEGIVIECVKAGKGNLFDCSLFCEMLATLLDVKIQIYNIISAVGCAKAVIKSLYKNTISQKMVPQKIHMKKQENEYLHKKYKIWKQQLSLSLMNH